MEDEKIKEYINADLAHLPEKEFGELFNAPRPSNDDYLDNLEWALMYLNNHKDASPLRWSEAEEHVFNLNTFDGAWLMNVDRIGGTGEDIKFMAPYTSCQPTVDMFPNINIKALNFGSNDGKMGERSLIALQKYRLMDSKEIRHLKGFKYVFEDRTAFVSKDEKWYTWGQYRACIPRHQEVDGKVVPVHVPIPVPRNPTYYFKDSDVLKYLKTDEYKGEMNRLNVVLSMRLTAYYEWFVYIKEDEKSLGVKIPIAPEGAKEVFSMREAPEGSKRKKAICNFVKSHYRNVQVKADYNEEVRQILVKQHLRGETKFNWRGLQVNIIPAEYDLNRIKTKKKFIQV